MLSVVDIANHNGDSDIGNSNDEQALVDLQLSLAAYTEVVVKSLSDTIPKLVYAQLVTQVSCRSVSGFCYVHSVETVHMINVQQRLFS